CRVCDLGPCPPFPTRRSSDLGGFAPPERAPAATPISLLVLCQVNQPSEKVPGRSSVVVLLSNGARLSCGALKKNSFPNLRAPSRSEEHTSELQSRVDLVCRLL